MSRIICSLSILSASSCLFLRRCRDAKGEPGLSPRSSVDVDDEGDILIPVVDDTFLLLSAAPPDKFLFLSYMKFTYMQQADTKNVCIYT